MKGLASLFYNVGFLGLVFQLLLVNLMGICYKFILGWLFFSSFVFSVLNISINETSIYFYLFVPFFDFSFIRFAINHKYNKKTIIYFFVVVLFSIPSNFINVNLLGFVKPILMLISVMYIYFLYVHRYPSFKLLYYFTSFSVLFAIFQFIITIYTGSEIVQPFYMAKLIWGEYGIQARPGFSDGLLFDYRVSGLSKEPGFFSSFLLCVLVFYGVDKKFCSKLFLCVIACGIALSLSKITLAFGVLVPLIYTFNRYIYNLNKIPLVVGGCVLVVFVTMLVGALYFYSSFIDIVYSDPWFAETYLHRSIGWYVLNFVFDERIFGFILKGGATEQLSCLVSMFPFLSKLRFVYIQPSIVFFSSNHAYVILQYGLAFFVSLLFFLQEIRVSFFSFLVFSVLISSVNMFAFENWVVLGFVFMLIYRDSNHKTLCLTYRNV